MATATNRKRGSADTAHSSSAEPLLVTVPDAARMLAIGRTSVYQLIWDGQLTPIRIGRNVRFAIAELERFVEVRSAP